MPGVSAAAPGSHLRIAGRRPPGRTIAVVLNSSAGALLGKPDQTPSLRSAFSEHGLAPVFIPADAGDLRKRIRLAIGSGADIIVVAGGDGSLACAAQFLVGTSTALGIIPTGTMNLLAKDLSIPVGDLSAAVRTVAHGAPRRIDVGEVNGRAFLCASMLGMPTRLAQHRETARGGPVIRLWSKFIRAAIRMISGYRTSRLDLELDGMPRTIHASSLTVTVNLLTDGAGRQLGRSRLDGGNLGLYVIRRVRHLDALRLAFAALRGVWRRDGAVEELSVQNISISSNQPAMRALVDGEPVLLRLPLRYRIRSRALRVIAPPVAPMATG